MLQRALNTNQYDPMGSVTTMSNESNDRAGPDPAPSARRRAPFLAQPAKTRLQALAIKYRTKPGLLVHYDEGVLTITVPWHNGLDKVAVLEVNPAPGPPSILPDDDPLWIVDYGRVIPMVPEPGTEAHIAKLIDRMHARAASADGDATSCEDEDE
jgi:hypothetical protein